jgi:hypothetical protein
MKKDANSMLDSSPSALNAGYRRRKNNKNFRPLPIKNTNPIFSE